VLTEHCTAPLGRLFSIQKLLALLRPLGRRGRLRVAPPIGPDERQRGGLTVADEGAVHRANAVARLREDAPQPGGRVVSQIEEHDVPHGGDAGMTNDEDVAVVNERRHEVAADEDELPDEESQEQEQEQRDRESRAKDEAPREL